MNCSLVVKHSVHLFVVGALHVTILHSPEDHLESLCIFLHEQVTNHRTHLQSIDVHAKPRPPHPQNLAMPWSKRGAYLNLNG